MIHCENKSVDIKIETTTICTFWNKTDDMNESLPPLWRCSKFVIDGARKVTHKSNLQIIQFKTDIFWEYLSEKMNVKL